MSPNDRGLENTTIRSAAEEADVAAWTPPPLPKPKVPAAIASLSKSDGNQEGRWNTSSLGLRVGVDAVAAATSGVLVAPIITMIDKGIIENASGKRSLGESLKASATELLTKPHRFLGGRPFGLIFCLYFGTYFTANTIDTIHSTIHPSPATTTTSGTPKFLATSSTNLALCLYKDSRFTQLFSTPTSTPRPVPLPTFALFTVRDTLTIFASFNLPPLLAPHLSRTLSSETQKHVSAASIAQFVTPAAVQIFSTPLHLLGLDLYNRPSGVGGVQILGADGRVSRVVRDWGKSAIARMGRIVPAFGVGGVVNMKVRRMGMERLE